MRLSRFSQRSERGAGSSRPIPAGQKKDKPGFSVVWREARDVIWARRYRLAAGFVLMGIGRIAGLVLPASSKYLIDEVVAKGRADLLVPLAAAAGLATLLQASTSFGLSQLLGVTARAITDHAGSSTRTS
jgi:subfamily B ATP-binding cassette protein MsbA